MGYLIMDRANVSLEVSCSLEAVVAHVTHEVVVLVDATDVVVQIRTTLKLLAAPGAKKILILFRLKNYLKPIQIKQTDFKSKKKFLISYFMGLPLLIETICG
jgi:hypothetical protein